VPSGCSWGAMSEMFTAAHRTLSHRVAGSVAVVAVAIVGSLTSAAGSAALASPGHAQVARVAARSSAQPATQVHHVSPVDSTGQLKPGYRVTDSGKGYCWTTSFVNPGLYRCFRGNFIMDPCWSNAGQTAVFCLAAPWSHSVTRLRLTRRLPPTSPGRSFLWGMTLRSGLQCAEPGGTHDRWHGHDVNYLCQRHWVLLDSPDRSRPVWRILTARYLHGHYHGRGVRPLSDAWLTKAP
jgi:hypothetical protein